MTDYITQERGLFNEDHNLPYGVSYDVFETFTDEEKKMYKTHRAQLVKDFIVWFDDNEYEEGEEY